MNLIKPQTLPELYSDILSKILLSIFNYFGIPLIDPSEINDAFYIKSLFFAFLFIAFLVFLKPIYLFTRKLLRTSAAFMSDKIILREILVIYAFIDDWTKRILYGLFLMCCTLLIYAISYFILLFTIVNFTRHVLGLEDLVMVFIYRV